jgi:hypothetical protein
MAGTSISRALRLKTRCTAPGHTQREVKRPFFPRAAIALSWEARNLSCSSDYHYRFFDT